MDAFLELSAAEQKKSTRDSVVYLLVDRLVVSEWDADDLHRVADSVGTAFAEGEGRMQVRVGEGQWLSFHNRLEADGMIFEDPVPHLFSFNHPLGACPTCEGYSQVLGIVGGGVPGAPDGSPASLRWTEFYSLTPLVGFPALVGFSGGLAARTRPASDSACAAEAQARLTAAFRR
jgi:hypothetical protein